MQGGPMRAIFRGLWAYRKWYVAESLGSFKNKFTHHSVIGILVHNKLNGFKRLHDNSVRMLLLEKISDR